MRPFAATLAFLPYMKVGDTVRARQIRIALVGCGNVGRALLALLATKAAALRDEHDVAFTFTGGLTRGAGGWLLAEGVSAGDLIATGWPRGPAPAAAQPFVGDGAAFAA